MRHLVIGTAGHIDHGKSALVQALTGVDPDRLKEEQARGITIDLGFAHYRTADVNYAFVDVPGHERFVRNMLAGATGIDAVLLVIASDESVMPQTREHFAICRLLRVPRGLIVLTKRDLVDEETLELVRLEARELVAGSFLASAPIVAVSSRTGEGLDGLRAALADLASQSVERGEAGAVRLPIDRVFTVKGFGTVVTGTLVSGRVDVDTELVLLPGGRRVKVRGVQVHGARQASAAAGQRTAVNLGGIDVGELERGQVLASPGTLEPTRRVDAVLELLHDARPLRHGARVRFHQGTRELLGRVSIATSPGESGAELAAGARARVRVRLEADAVVTRGDRFIVRAYSPPMTIGGGEVLDPHPPRVGVRTAAGRARLERLDTSGRPDPAAALLVMIEERGLSGLPSAHVVSRAGVPPADAPALVARLVELGTIARAGDRLVSVPRLRAASEQLLAQLAEHHRRQPLSEGLPREEARERLIGHHDAAVFDRILEDLVAAGRIVARDHLALASHRVSLSEDEARVRADVERAYLDAGLRPPDAATLSASLGQPADVVDRVVRLMLRQKALVRIDTLLFHAEALQRLKDDLAGLKQAGSPARVDVTTFKERYGITRKFAIPLLEYLDRERITRRVGEARVIL
jgi:selenocysteine-specific elongation factor